jgi:drug/metabolite transporter (DMT)-like permease
MHLHFVPWEEAEASQLHPAAASDAPSRAVAAAVTAAPRAPETTRSQLLGILMVLASSLLFSSSNFFIFLVARVGSPIPPAQTLCVRFFFQAGLSILATLLTRRGRLRDRRVWLGLPGNEFKLIARGVFGVGGLGCWVWLLSNVSLSDAAAITFLNVPLTAVFARLYLKEPYTKLDALTGLLGLLGVVLVAQPASVFGAATGAMAVPLSPLSVAVGLCGACFSACAFLSIRTIGPGEDAYVVTLAFAVLGCVFSPLALLATAGGWQPVERAAQSWLLVGVGITGFFGQLLMNAGMGRAPAGPAAVMRYLDLVNALWMQSVLLEDVPNGLKWTGCLLVLSSVVSTIHKHKVKARLEEERAKEAAAAAAVAASD